MYKMPIKRITDYNTYINNITNVISVRKISLVL